MELHYQLFQSLLKFSQFFSFIFIIFFVSSLFSSQKDTKFFDFETIIHSLLIVMGVTSLWAVFHTRFQSAQTISLILILWYIFANVKQLSFDWARFKCFSRKLPYLFLVCLISFSFFEVWNYGVIWFDGYQVHQDAYFYGLISKSLSKYGCENYYHGYAQFSPKFQPITGYHFFELWMNNWMTSLFGWSPLSNLYSFALPFFLVLIFLLVLALAEELQTKTHALVILLAVLVIDGIYFHATPIGKIFGGSVRGLSMQANHEFKYFVWYVFVFFMFYFFVLRKDLFKGGLVAVLACTASYMYVPVVGFVLLAGLVYSFLKKREEFWKMMLLLILFCGVFYLGIDWESIEKAEQYVKDSKLYAGIRVAGLIFSSITSFGLIFIFSVKDLVPRIWRQLVFPFSMLVISGLCYFLLYDKHDSHQIFFSTQHAVMFLMVAYAFLHLKPRTAFVMAGIFFISKLCWSIVLFEIYPDGNYALLNKKTKTIDEFVQKDQTIPVFLPYNIMRFEDTAFQPHYKKPFIFFDCYEVLANNDHLYPVSISDFEVFKNQGPFRNQYIEFMKGGSVLFAFAKDNGWEVNETNVDSVVFKFMKHHQFDKVLHKNDVILPTTFVAKEKICDENGNCLTLIELL